MGKILVTLVFILSISSLVVYFIDAGKYVDHWEGAGGACCYYTPGVFQ